MCVFIIALRRSGTTIFWRTLRQDRRFVSYDEPFNPILHNLPAQDAKGTRDEFIRLFKQNINRFRTLFKPIPPEEELHPKLNLQQQEYLRWLISTGKNVICDTTRCNFKVRSLYEIDPKAILIHLYRSPAAFASSHLLPSGGTERWQRRFANVIRRKTFWWRKGWYNSWHLEDIIDRLSGPLFRNNVCEIGLNPDEVCLLPAVGKLLAYWRIAFERAQKDGYELFGQRFLSVSFEEFCQNPQQTIDQIYELLPFSKITFDYSKIHPAQNAFCSYHPNWSQYSKLLRLPVEAL
ncbi:MAG: sulfotransferase [Planctomycetes bacterium]|nr:sulfotransferase [Planctomycetota bacterium]